jgi:hypothetical protein
VSHGNLKRLNNVKAVFQTRPFKYLYISSPEYFICWLKHSISFRIYEQLSLITQASKWFLKERRAKKRDKEPKFLLTPAMNGK